MKKRLIGIDVARALAVIGMILVNFKIVFGGEGQSWVKSFASVFDGKAAATFVVLAGVGIALMTNSSLKNKDLFKLKIARIRILKRALFLFVVGISYIAIWPADILHFYGIYMIAVFFLLSCKRSVILISCFILIAAFPILMIFSNYESGWNFETLVYKDFWTLKGFARNLFFNGFHPVIPWTAFMLFGFWFGKLDLYNHQLVRNTFWTSFFIFIAIQIVSYVTISVISNGNQEIMKELNQIIGTSPMPPLPMYMLNGIAFSSTIISLCILIARRFEQNIVIKALTKTGQLALTFYVAHVILGMGAVEIFYPNQFGNFSIGFSMIYAISFSILCVLFAIVWRKYFTIGPLEWVMRKITD